MVELFPEGRELPQPAGLPAGERQVLSLSFIVALAAIEPLSK